MAEIPPEYVLYKVGFWFFVTMEIVLGFLELLIRRIKDD